MCLFDCPCILYLEETAQQAWADLTIRACVIRVKAPSKKERDGLWVRVSILVHRETSSWQVL